MREGEKRQSHDLLHGSSETQKPEAPYHTTRVPVGDGLSPVESMRRDLGGWNEEKVQAYPDETRNGWLARG